MRYLSLFSGIEAASAAWHPMGWRPVAFSQFDPEHKGKGPDFASAVLAHHYPDVPNVGDVTKADFDAIGPVELVVFGSPCQSFSVAGKRLGMDDPRGNLALIGGQIVYRKRPRWFVFENVPGLLSSDSGWDFGTLLASFAGYPPGAVFSPPEGGWQNRGYVQQALGGYGLAWAVLDSQFCRVDGFGRAVPQRRRRLFVVGYLGDWRRAAAVLFERESVSGNPAPRRQSGERVAGAVAASSARRGGVSEGERGGLIEVVSTLSESSGHARPGDNIQSVDYLIPVAGTIEGAAGRSRGAGTSSGMLVPEVANPLTARMHKGINTTMDEGQTMIGEAIAFDCKAGANTGFAVGEVPGALRGEGHGGGHAAIAFSCKDHGADAGAIAPTLRSMGHDGSHANGGGQVAVAFQPRFARNGRGAPDEVAAALTGEAGRTGKGDSAQCVAFNITPSNSNKDYNAREAAYAQALTTASGQPPSARGGTVMASAWAVRRLTPTECERLQGYKDGYTNIPWRGKNGAPDGPRYKALGNSMSVNVMAWLGHRIEMVEEIIGMDP